MIKHYLIVVLIDQRLFEIDFLKRLLLQELELNVKLDKTVVDIQYNYQKQHSYWMQVSKPKRLFILL